MIALCGCFDLQLVVILTLSAVAMERVWLVKFKLWCHFQVANEKWSEYLFVVLPYLEVQVKWHLLFK